MSLGGEVHNRIQANRVAAGQTCKSFSLKAVSGILGWNLSTWVRIKHCELEPTNARPTTGTPTHLALRCSCLARRRGSIASRYSCKLQKAQRGCLPGTGSGIRQCCACLELCIVASWSDARLMHLELACLDSDASRLCLRCYLLGRLPPSCSQQACWSVLVFPPTRPVIAGGQSFVSSN